MDKYNQPTIEYNKYRKSPGESIELLSTKIALEEILDFKGKVLSVQIDESNLLTVQTTNGSRTFDLDCKKGMADIFSTLVRGEIDGGYKHASVYEQTRKTYALIKTRSINGFNKQELLEKGWKIEAQYTGKTYKYAIVSSNDLYLRGEEKLSSPSFSMIGHFCCDVTSLVYKYKDKNLRTFVEDFVSCWPRQLKVDNLLSE